jgi:hypothetical protein
LSEWLWGGIEVDFLWECREGVVKAWWEARQVQVRIVSRSTWFWLSYMRSKVRHFSRRFGHAVLDNICALNDLILMWRWLANCFTLLWVVYAGSARVWSWNDKSGVISSKKMLTSFWGQRWWNGRLLADEMLSCRSDCEVVLRWIFYESVVRVWWRHGEKLGRFKYELCSGQRDFGCLTWGQKCDISVDGLDMLFWTTYVLWMTW